VLQNVVDRMGLREPHDFQQSLFGPVLRTMARGVRVDKEARTRMLRELKDHAHQLETEVHEMVGYPLNPKSPKQMQHFFYEEMGLAPQRKRKTKALSCDDEALEKLAAKEILVRPIVTRIKEFRSCETLASNALKANAIGYDGRIHCSYNITGTITFRFSSSTDAFGSGMNLQNITSGDEE
jgi:DNA polymerase I-like protein with 3'-5' exonuclease and polymerase domains